jgi:hypothetical protein
MFSSFLSSHISPLLPFLPFDQICCLVLLVIAYPFAFIWHRIPSTNLRHIFSIFFTFLLWQDLFGYTGLYHLVFSASLGYLLQLMHERIYKISMPMSTHQYHYLVHGFPVLVFVATMAHLSVKYVSTIIDYVLTFPHFKVVILSN